MEKTELEFVYFMRATSGSSRSNLFQSTFSADNGNREKLSLGFPNEMKMVHRYQNEDGYWQELQKRLE